MGYVEMYLNTSKGTFVKRFLKICLFQIKTKQQQAQLILNGKKIPFEKIDISEDKDLRTRMRELCENPTALPPQLFYRDYYLGVRSCY